MGQIRNQRKIKKYIETNKNKTQYNAAKAALRGKFIVL